jgi:aryl-alcohol dehydrogenase-like predicted oxidoreductase
MDYVRLGSTGLKISRLGLGMMSYGDPAEASWYLDEERAEPLVRQAVEAGVTFFDTADVYSHGVSEVVTGRLLSRLFGSREDYVLATKVHYPMGPSPLDRGLSRRHIMSAVDASLRRLGTDYVDLYQIHRWDPETPIEETTQALHDVVRAGKARYVGASLMYAWQFAKAQAVAPTPFVSMQTRYNLLYREEEREMLPLCADLGVAVVPYSPLARGRLVGARTTQRSTVEESGESDSAVVAALATVASARGIAPAQAALAWVLTRPGMSAPILGATRSQHLDDAVAALDLRLSPEEVAALEAPYRPQAPYGYT